MDSYFRKNLELLQSHTSPDHSLSEEIAETVSIVTTASGRKSLKYQDIFLHSSYDPVAEGSKFLREVSPNSIVCLYGYGLGYHIEPFLKRIENGGFLLAIELNPDILSAAMTLNDQSYILKHPQFHLIHGRDEQMVSREISSWLGKLIDGAPDANLQVKIHNPSLKCVPQGFDKIVNALEVLLIERRVPTIFGGIESGNFAHNRDIVSRCPGIKSFTGRHQGQRTLLVGAGPSLDNVLPYMKKLAKDAIVASVDTAFPVLLDEGIQPDYVFSLDPQEESFKYFSDHLNNPATLIFLPSAHSKIIHNYSGEKWVVFKEGHSLTLQNQELAKVKGLTSAGGSVSVFALDCLMQLGCNPIFLAGQDCSFSGNRTYSRHAGINLTFLDKSDRFNTLDVKHFEKVSENKTVEIQNVNGHPIPTNQVMFGYLRNLEQFSESHPQHSLYSFLSSGAKVRAVPGIGNVAELYNEASIII